MWYQWMEPRHDLRPACTAPVEKCICYIASYHQRCVSCLPDTQHVMVVSFHVSCWMGIELGLPAVGVAMPPLVKRALATRDETLLLRVVWRAAVLSCQVNGIDDHLTNWNRDV